jgi:hypothetical protein
MRVTEVSSRTSASYSDALPIAVQCVKLAAVSDPANKSWATATPCGTVELQINNPEAFDQLKVGAYFFVDFTPAPAKESDETK